MVSNGESTSLPNGTTTHEDGPYAVEYRLYVDGAAIDVGTVTSYSVDGLSPGTTHTFRVVIAVDEAGNRSAPATVTVTP